MARSIKKESKTVSNIGLEKYTGGSSRHTCPNCGSKKAFARYVFKDTGEYLADDVGRCNKTVKCGYHKPPSEANTKGKKLFVPLSQVKKEYRVSNDTSLVDYKEVMKSRLDIHNNNFTKFLLSKFKPEVVYFILNRYLIGTHDRWKDSTVFWQIDSDFDVRTGKIMLYNESTGKRVKEPMNCINWVHSLNKNYNSEYIQDFNLKQCFFGEHLLNIENVQTFRVVESEKTAIICSILNPSTYWIATGGLQNIGEERLLPFKDKELIFYPDKGEAFKMWENKLKPFMGDYTIKLDTTVENSPELVEGDDMADLILKKFVN